MSTGLISTQQAADRLGLTTSALHELRWRDDGLSIVQQGLVVGYRLADLQAFEEREVLAVVRQVMASERPLPLIRTITAAVMSQPARPQGASIVQTLTDEIARLRAISAGQVVEIGRRSNRWHSQAMASRPFF